MRTCKPVKYLALAAFLAAYLVPVAVGWRSAGVFTQTWMGAPAWIACGVVLWVFAFILKVRQLAPFAGAVLGLGMAIPFWIGLAIHPEWLYVLALATAVYVGVWIAGRRSVNAYALTGPGPRGRGSEA